MTVAETEGEGFDKYFAPQVPDVTTTLLVPLKLIRPCTSYSRAYSRTTTSSSPPRAYPDRTPPVRVHIRIQPPPPRPPRTTPRTTLSARLVHIHIRPPPARPLPGPLPVSPPAYTSGRLADVRVQTCWLKPTLTYTRAMCTQINLVVV